jgi:hypothetical protein
MQPDGERRHQDHHQPPDDLESQTMSRKDVRADRACTRPARTSPAGVTSVLQHAPQLPLHARQQQSGTLQLRHFWRCDDTLQVSLQTSEAPPSLPC